MRFLTLALQYVGRNFFPLLLMAAAPAVMLAFFVRPMQLITFMASADWERADGVNAMFAALADVRYPLALTFLLPVTAAFFSFLSGFTEHKMRMGVFDIRGGILRRARYGAAGVVVPFFIATALYFIWQYLTVFVLYFVRFAFYVLADSRVLTAVFTSLAGAAMLFLFLSALSHFILWPAALQISGYGFSDSWRYQLRLLSGNAGRMLVALLFPCFVSAALTSVCGFFLDGAIIYVYALCHFFNIVYVVALSMTAYFDIASMERKDLERKRRYAGF